MVGRTTLWRRTLCLVMLLVVVAPPSAMSVGIAETIDALLADPALRHGVSGALVESLRDGRVVYSRNADKSFMPASNMKLLTTAAALDALGPGYRSGTLSCFDGNTSASIWRGRLFLKGAGDPTLSTKDLDDFARSLRKKGLRRIDGGVVGDESRFTCNQLGFGWSWDDEQWYYAAPVGALNLNENSVGVYVDPARREGQPAIVRVIPPTSHFTVRNTALTTSGGEAEITVSRLHHRDVILVSGAVPIDYHSDKPVERISVQDPATYAAMTMTEALARAGISVRDKPGTGVTPASAKTIGQHLSPPLSQVLTLINKPSDNTIAEILFRTLAAERGKAATEDEARALELAFLKKIGADTASVVIADGSGLSRRNYISPACIVAILRYMNSQHCAAVFRDSLPVAGVDGTLANRMKGTMAAKNVQAKTGYVSQASSLSGYLATASGETLVFSVLMNNHMCPNADAKAIQDKICLALCALK
jgi:serine-type D-Ala-D-Ala carboxypeptidase/endopeptidase (penicillin-binding protein 4)